MKQLHFACGFLSLLITPLLVASPALAVSPTEKKHDWSKQRQVASGFAVAPGMKIELFAVEPMVKNPVTICLDEKGRVYVAETFRQKRGVEDNRLREYWLLDDLASQQVEDRLLMYEKWKQRVPMTHFTATEDRIRRLEDRDGDGVADQVTVFSDKYNHPLDGTGAGLIARGGSVYYTCIPKLYRLPDADDDGVADQREPLVDGFGVRVALRGHDMHGLVWGPDGKLYFSIGDRGYHVTTPDGKVHADPGSGAVFRCNPDGSEFEVFARSLRNPQELAFDQYGNLFTGDNNSDAGDKARIVYVCEGGESGRSNTAMVNAKQGADYEAQFVFDRRTRQPNTRYSLSALVGAYGANIKGSFRAVLKIGTGTGDSFVATETKSFTIKVPGDLGTEAGRRVVCMLDAGDVVPGRDKPLVIRLAIESIKGTELPGFDNVELAVHPKR